MLPLVLNLGQPEVQELQASRHTFQPLQKLKPTLYITIIVTWVVSLVWFHPRLATLLSMAHSPATWLALAFFILFLELAWLYGFYNIFLIFFAAIYRWKRSRMPNIVVKTGFSHPPAVAVLYTTCNDLKWESLKSCLDQDYPNFTVYILDDSTDPESKAEVDKLHQLYRERTVVVRRTTRKGFKAGNLNHALSTVVTKEPYFAIADADEILPEDFLSRMVPQIHGDPCCGFLQANHVSNPAQKSKLAKALGIGIDIHWKWHQSLRNQYGFVMFLGHGALIRRICWEQCQGFPEIVSEDLAFAIRVRELGYRGKFIEDVVCKEDFPETIRAFRIRHMKWTRGTCEFLFKEAGSLIRSKRITWMEKMDILFPTLNLPLTMFYFLFMIDANLLLPWMFGELKMLTFTAAGTEFDLPIVVLTSGFSSLFTWDFFAVTIMTFFAPVLCFVISLIHRPVRLWKFLSHSTVVYAALSPLSTIGTLSYLLTREARFLVTGDTKQASVIGLPAKGLLRRRGFLSDLLKYSHPDFYSIRLFEIVTGVVFALVCLYMFQVSFFGLCLTFILLPVMHYMEWDTPLLRWLVFLPFLLILAGIFLSSLSVLGIQTVFFGYGFHF